MIMWIIWILFMLAFKCVHLELHSDWASQRGQLAPDTVGGSVLWNQIGACRLQNTKVQFSFDKLIQIYVLCTQRHYIYKMCRTYIQVNSRQVPSEDPSCETRSERAACKTPKYSLGFDELIQIYVRCAQQHFFYKMYRTYIQVNRRGIRPEKRDRSAQPA